jgi:putative membrane protein
MFIDYVTLMLINMVAGLFILGAYVYFGLNDKDQKRWVPGFGIPGLVAFLCGFLMIITWPLPGPFNMAFGEMSVMLGILLLATAVSLSRGWDLSIIAVYAFFAGLAAVVIGNRILDMGLTKSPRLAGAGFILTGLCGMLAYPALCLKKFRVVRLIGAMTLFICALIWAIIGYGAYWSHMATLAKYVPSTMVQ